jgi:hypothetical protein
MRPFVQSHEWGVKYLMHQQMHLLLLSEGRPRDNNSICYDIARYDCIQKIAAKRSIRSLLTFYFRIQLLLILEDSHFHSCCMINK